MTDRVPFTVPVRSQIVQLGVAHPAGKDEASLQTDGRGDTRSPALVSHLLEVAKDRLLVTFPLGLGREGCRRERGQNCKELETGRIFDISPSLQARS